MVQKKSVDVGNAIAMIPAPGWKVEYQEEDGNVFSIPLDYWLIIPGEGPVPTQIDPECCLFNVVYESTNFVRLVNPREE